MEKEVGLTKIVILLALHLNGREELRLKAEARIPQ